MTIFLILVVAAGVLIVANVNGKALSDRRSNFFYGDGGAGYSDGGGGSDGGCGDGGGSGCN